MKNIRSLQRQETIMHLLATQGTASIEEMMMCLEISEWTLRRDLAELEARRLIVRHYGGASLANGGRSQNAENAENFQTSLSRNIDAKVRIGRRTATLLHEDQLIALGAGTTTTEVARGLKELNKHERIVTNALNIALELSDHLALQISCTGGDAHGDYYTLNGPVAERAVRAHFYDVAVIGVSGITAQGYTVNSLLNAAVLCTMIDQSQRLLVVADSSKFGCSRLAKLASLDHAALLVTDALPPEPLLDALDSAGVTVIVAE